MQNKQFWQGPHAIDIIPCSRACPSDVSHGDHVWMFSLKRLDSLTQHSSRHERQVNAAVARQTLCSDVRAQDSTHDTIA